MDAFDPANDWRAALHALPDGARVGSALMDDLLAELSRRAAQAGAGADWREPLLSDLHVRKEGLPEAWTAGGNLLLAGPDADPVTPEPGLNGLWPGRDGLLVVGAGVRLHKANLMRTGGMIVVGDGANLFASTLTAIGGATVSIGEGTTSTWLAQLDARNGGAILVGADGMWANGVRIMTDDMHAIQDLETGRRLNRFGGRIVVERHVWLSEQVTVMGDSRIGADAVVGQGAFVKGELGANTLSLGRPARVVRRGVTWSRDDAP